MSTAPSRAIIDLEAYAHNLRIIRKQIPRNCFLIPVVKANAYGHGALPVAKRAVQEWATMLGVATVEEAIQLQDGGITTASLLILMQPSTQALDEVVARNFRVILSDLSLAQALGETARRLRKTTPVHIMVDTGMGRQGFSMEETLEAVRHVTRISHLDLEGIATHFPDAENRADAFTTVQIRQFKTLLKLLEKEGAPFEIVHAANSAAIFHYPESTFDAVRPGLATYGVWPMESPPPKITLRPVLRWESEIILVKTLPKGATIGYGRTYEAQAPIKTAVIPVGYADGYRIGLSNRGDVLVRGTRCPILGRISMDQTVIDVTHLPGITAGEKVTLIGRDEDQEITAWDLARLSGTIPYDILTGISNRVERVYTGGEGNSPAGTA